MLISTLQQKMHHIYSHSISVWCITVSLESYGLFSLFCSMCPRLEVIDFGTQYTTQTHSKEFVIENRGRQPRKLVWNLESLEENSEAQGKSKPFYV